MLAKPRRNYPGHSKITRAISTDLAGRSRCNRCQTIKLWALNLAQQVPRDACGFAWQGAYVVRGLDVIWTKSNPTNLV
jgi:hypothetical protein